MNLHELKKELESDASKRCAEQEKTIKNLHEQIKERDKLVGQLMNRCRVNSSILGGALCFWCGCREECETRQKNRKEEAQSAEN